MASPLNVSMFTAMYAGKLCFTPDFQGALSNQQGMGGAAAPCCPRGRGPSQSEHPKALSYEQNVCPVSECNQPVTLGCLTRQSYPRQVVTSLNGDSMQPIGLENRNFTSET